MTGEEEQIMAHEETMQLHEAGLRRQGTGPHDRARLLDTVIESELEGSDDALANFAAKDFPLSNFEEEVDTIEIKWMQEILDLFNKARYPHPKSGLEGLSRAWAAGDSGQRQRAIGLDEFAQDESYKLGTFSRAKRGEDMAQQETSAKQIQETHAVNDGANSSGSSGLLGRFRG